MRSILRIVLIDHPLLAFLIALGPTWLVLTTLARRTAWPGPTPDLSRRLIRIASFVFLALYLALVTWYFVTPKVVDHLEPSLMAASWLFVEGRPVYLALDAGEIYSLAYGPAAYLVYGLVFVALGPGFLVARLPGVLAGLLGLALTYLALRRFRDREAAWSHTGLLALLFLLFEFKSFRARVDPLILASVATGLWGVGVARWSVAAVLCGVVFGFCVNVKLHCGLYCLPIVVLLWRRHGLRSVIVCGAAALASFVLPFLLFPQISLEPYVQWVSSVSRHGLLPGAFVQNLGWAVLLCVPLAVVVVRLRRTAPETLGRVVVGQVPLLLLLAPCVLLAAVAGSKIGAGPHHLMPFTPLLVYGLAALPTGFDDGTRRDLLESLGVASALLAFTAASLVSATATTGRDVAYVQRLPAASVAEDIRQVLDAHPDASVQMGYGARSDYHLSWQRPLLVFRGHPYLFDPGSLMEYRRSGLAIPDATLEILRSGRTTLWLIPKDSRPFEMDSLYRAPGGQAQDLFGDAFRDAFQSCYEPRGSSRYFDLWHLKDGPCGTPG